MVESYRIKPTRADGEKIYAKFININGRYPMNIQGTTRDAIVKKIKGGVFDASLFDEAQNEVYLVLRMDNFGRYVNSKAYKSRPK